MTESTDLTALTAPPEGASPVGRVLAFERSVLFATACGLVAGQLIRNRRRRQIVDPVALVVGAGSAAHPARDVAAWLANDAGVATRSELFLLAAFGTGLTLAYLSGASHGLARGVPRLPDTTA